MGTREGRRPHKIELTGPAHRRSSSAAMRVVAPRFTAALLLLGGAAWVSGCPGIEVTGDSCIDDASCKGDRVCIEGVCAPPPTEDAVGDSSATDTPATDTPVTDTTGPDTTGPDTTVTDTPGTDTPVTDTPGTDTPVTDTPGTDTPGTDTPGTDTPGTDTSVTDTSGTDTPVTDTSVTDTSGTDTSGTDTSGTDTSVGDGGSPSDVPVGSEPVVTGSLGAGSGPMASTNYQLSGSLGRQAGQQAMTSTNYLLRGGVVWTLPVP